MCHLKCLHWVSDTTFDAFVKLFKRALPKDATLLDSFKKIRMMIKQFDVGYEKIDACANDYVLFWKDKAELSRCAECNAIDEKEMKLASGKPIPVRILHHFPLIPRGKILYMSYKIALLMRWHTDGRIKDGKLRHPADV